MDDFLLHELDDAALENIIELSGEEQLLYFSQLVEKYYTHIKVGTTEHVELVKSYRSSFYAEKLYRNNDLFQDYFTVVYTRTGLIREIINDMYYTEESLIIH